MNLYSELDRYSPEQLDHLHDAAKQRAVQLRQQAVADFWQDLAVGLSNQNLRARRAAERLASSLARHLRLRSAAAAAEHRSSEACC